MTFQKQMKKFIKLSVVLEELAVGKILLVIIIIIRCLKN